MEDLLKNIAFDKLITFSHIIKYRSINQVIERTGLTRRRIYHDIETLENNLGNTIFIKNKNDIILTSFGYQITPTLQRMANLLYQDEFNYNRQEIIFDLSIASSALFAHYFLPFIFKDYQDQYPQALINLSQYHPHFAPTIYEYDIVIGAGPLQESEKEEAEQITLKNISLGYYAAPEFLKTYTPPTTLQALYAMPSVHHKDDGNQSAFSNILLTSDSYFSLNAMVAEGIGIGALINEEVAHNPRFQHLIRLLPAITLSEISLCLKYARHSIKKTAIAPFIHYCKARMTNNWPLFSEFVS